MDDSSDRPSFCGLRSEQEREKRRMRDRERRRSMTSEQRERHLARRRRNYQLRMQRVKRRDPGIQPKGTNADLGSGINGKETLAYDLTKLHRRLRLIHVKHFARSLKRPLGELAVNNIPIPTDSMMKGNQVSCCKSVHGVRLNHVKQLARGRKSAPKETSEQLPLSETEGNSEKQNLLPVEGHRSIPTDGSGTEVIVSQLKMDWYSSSGKLSVSRHIPPGDR